MKNFGKLLIAIGFIMVVSSVPFGSGTATQYLISSQEAKATTRWWSNCS
jgi:hypothetical protein